MRASNRKGTTKHTYELAASAAEMESSTDCSSREAMPRPLLAADGGTAPATVLQRLTARKPLAVMPKQDFSKMEQYQQGEGWKRGWRGTVSSATCLIVKIINKHYIYIQYLRAGETMSHFEEIGKYCCEQQFE